MVATPKMIYFLHISQVPSIHKPHLLPLPPVFLDRNNFFYSQLNNSFKKIYPLLKVWGGGGEEKGKRVVVLAKNKGWEKEKHFFDLI